jgi:prenyl protein peptidase
MHSGLLTPLLRCDVKDTSPGLGRAVAYCLIVSCSFVGSIYVCVPSHVRRLDRDDPRQIRWRSTAVSIACIGAVLLYPKMMCQPLQLASENSDSPKDLLLAEIRTCGSALLHISLLYLGPIARNAFVVRGCLQQQQHKPNASFRSFLYTYYVIFVEPTLSSFLHFADSSRGGWITWRNLVISPITEELVFRGCIVSALTSVSSGSSAMAPVPLSTARLAIVAPLFFGLSHVHHGAVSLRRGEPIRAAAKQTVLQFAYTFLFGSYATYLFFETRSLLAATLCHAYCNGMGLPDLTFLQQHSPLHLSRRWITAVHVAGLLSFLRTIRIVYAQ